MLDLRDRKGLALAKKLIFKTLVLIAGFRPDVMEGLEFGSDDVTQSIQKLSMGA